MRIAVIGHVEHITLGRVPAVPKAGEIAHLASPRTFAGGGGGLAFSQLARSEAQVLLFTAFGSDDAGREVEAAVRATGATIHAARRAEPHTRDLVLITPDGERTIIVTGEPLHPRAGDALPWAELAGCDGAYFTAQDPAGLRAARAARMLVVTARRRAALDASGVKADVVVGSANDPRERCTLSDFTQPPDALVLTEGAQGGRVFTASGEARWEAVTSPCVVSAYGAGDSFAGALTFFLSLGLPADRACAEAGRYGAAVLGSNTTPVDAQLPLLAKRGASDERKP